MSDTRTMWKPIQGADIRLTQPIETVGQQAIPWCTTHKRSVERGAQLLDKPVVCSFHTDMRDPDYGDCVISTGGPEHKWWVDV